MHRRAGKPDGAGRRTGQSKRCERSQSKSARVQIQSRDESAALAELQTIYQQTPVGLCFVDRELRYAKINEQLARINGRPVADHIGRTVREVLPSSLADRLEPILKKVIETGVSVENLELRDLDLPPESSARVLRVDYRAVRDARGNILGVNAAVADITVHEEIEQALRESRERLRLIFNNVKDYAIFTLDLNGIVTSWNPGAEKVFGFAEDEIMGRDGAILYTPEDRAKHAPQKEMNRARDKDYSPDERWHMRKDGSRLFVSGAVRPLSDEQDRIRGFIKVAQDVTLRHEVEQQLASRLRQQEAVAQLGQMALQGGDEQSLMDRTVAVVANTLGVEFSKILESRAEGRELLLRAGVGWRPDAIGAIYAVAAQRSQSGFTLVSEKPVISDDLRVEQRFETMPLLKEHGVCSSITVVIKGQPGRRAFGVLGACSTDLHKFSPNDANFLQAVANVLAVALERKRVEHALTLSEQQFRELADAMPQMVWTTQPDGQPDYFNQRWYEFTGQGPEQSLASDGWHPVVHPEDLPVCLESWSRSLKSGEHFELQSRYRKHDGSYRWFLIRAEPVKDELGRIIRWFGSSTDIDDQRRATEALKQARERLHQYAEDLERRVAERTATLQESVQSLEGVLYHVAHDLRAPLRAMQGLTTLLLEEYAPRFDAEGRDYAARIVAAASRMDALIRDLLAYGRLGHMRLPVHRVDLEKLMKFVVESLGDEISAKGAQVDVQHPLPPVYANDTVLQQVGINLLSNALKFVPPGVAPCVRIWSEIVGQKVRLYFQDNGIGIEPEHHQRIFRVFERLHRTEDFPGTGIGLAIVGKGMERMGGSVGLESQPGAGSLFWIELPMPPAPDSRAA